MSNEQDRLHGLRFEAHESPTGSGWLVYCAWPAPAGACFVQAALYGLTEQEALALANLLNAAPAMLEACGYVDEVAPPDDPEADDSDIITVEVTIGWVREARAALKAAKGETQ